MCSHDGSGELLCCAVIDSSYLYGMHAWVHVYVCIGICVHSGHMYMYIRVPTHIHRYNMMGGCIDT